MRSQHGFKTGIRVLIEEHLDWLAGARVGLLTHQAAVDTDGKSSAEMLHAVLGSRLTALFGPEHGLCGDASAGQPVRSFQHPAWGIPVFSLYGRTKGPTSAMLRRVDVLVVDLQNLPVRCYTYVSTLRHVLVAATKYGKRIVVADRPVPLPCVVDGPMLDPLLTSFVGCINTSFCYGMTPAEVARYISDFLSLELDLKVAPMRGYHRDTCRSSNWPPWIPPSPAIRSWESALCYPATVFSEALPALDAARNGQLPFQTLALDGISAHGFAEKLCSLGLPGVAFHRHWFFTPKDSKRRLHEGVRLTVTHPETFKPACTAIALLYVAQQFLGRRLWPGDTTRLEFFDKLWGDRRVRSALQGGAKPGEICSMWEAELNAFRRVRQRYLLYHV